MRTKYLALSTVLLIAGCGTPANHPDVDAVLTEVQALFDAMEAGDGAAIAELFAPDGRLIIMPKDGGGAAPNIVSGAEWAANFPTDPGQMLEKMYSPEVRIDGDMAMVWASYDFHLGDEFSHCGVDLLDMAKIDGQWRILTITFTRQTVDCPDRSAGGRSYY